MQGVHTVVVAGGPRLADLWHGVTAVGAGPAATVTGGGILVVIAVALLAFAVPALVRYQGQPRA